MAGMPTQDDVRRIATSLPEVTEEAGSFAFRVRGKAFAWVWLERPDPPPPRAACRIRMFWPFGWMARWRRRA